MRYRRFLVVFISSLIVLLTLAALARADSPEGRTKLGDHLNLSGLDQSSNQAGFTLFNQDDPPSDGEDDDQEGGDQRHPVAVEIADYFAENYDPNVTYEDVMGLHEQGYGFGTITKVYLMAPVVDQNSKPDTLLGFLDEAQQKGWGNLLKGNGVHPGSLASVGTVMGNRPDHAGPPDHAGQKSGAGPEFEQNGIGGGLSGPGHSGNPGKSKGKENGKAKGKNK